MNILTHKYADTLVENKLKVYGEYEFRVHKATGEHVRTVVVPNLITTAGLNKWVGSKEACRNYIFIGTGTNPPTFSDTQMGVYKTYKAVGSPLNETNSGAPDYITTLTSYTRFAVGAATGNITEVGIGWITDFASVPNNHRVFSRALIQDVDGDPVTITVLADESLDVYYRLRYYPDLEDKFYDLTVNGTTYSITQRMFDVASTTKMATLAGSGGYCALENSCYVSTSSSLISNTTIEGNGTWVPDAPRTYDAYVADSFTLSGYMAIPPAAGAIAIQSIFMQSIEGYRDLRIKRQILLSAPLSKTILQELRVYQNLVVSRYTP